MSLGCAMQRNSGVLHVPFLKNAKKLFNFSFVSYFLPFVFRFTSSLPQPCSSPTGVMRCSAGMRYSAYCLSEPQDHLSARLNASLSNTMHRTQLTDYALLPTVLLSQEENNTAKPYAPLSLLFHLNLWRLGQTRLTLSSSHPNTKMSGSKCRPGETGPPDTKGSRGVWMNGGLEELYPLLLP